MFWGSRSLSPLLNIEHHFHRFTALYFCQLWWNFHRCSESRYLGRVLISLVREGVKVTVNKIEHHCHCAFIHFWWNFIGVQNQDTSNRLAFQDCGVGVKVIVTKSRKSLSSLYRSSFSSKFDETSQGCCEPRYLGRFAFHGYAVKVTVTKYIMLICQCITELIFHRILLKLHRRTQNQDTPFRLLWPRSPLLRELGHRLETWPNINMPRKTSHNCKNAVKGTNFN